MIFNFVKTSIDVDVGRTKRYYDSANSISDNCSCTGCRNYEKAMESISLRVLQFFSQLGVDIKKAREVYAICTNTDHSVSYGGFYHICGKVIDGVEAFIITDDFEVYFGEKCDLLDEYFPLPAIQIYISANIPWVLNEPNTY